MQTSLNSSSQNYRKDLCTVSVSVSLSVSTYSFSFRSVFSHSLFYMAFITSLISVLFISCFSIILEFSAKTSKTPNSLPFIVDDWKADWNKMCLNYRLHYYRSKLSHLRYDAVKFLSCTIAAVLPLCHYSHGCVSFAVPNKRMFIFVDPL